MNSEGWTSKAEFERLAVKRLRDARVLFGPGEYECAYYLGGYAVECARKAVIVKSNPPQVLPPKKFLNGVYTHNLEELLN